MMYFFSLIPIWFRLPWSTILAFFSFLLHTFSPLQMSSIRSTLLHSDEDITPDVKSEPTPLVPSLAFLKDTTTAGASEDGEDVPAGITHSKNGNGKSNGHHLKSESLSTSLLGTSSSASSTSSLGAAPVAAVSAAPASSLSRNSTSAAFRPSKVLGPDVVVLRGVSKRYKLAGREEEVVALRAVDLIPYDEVSNPALAQADHIGPIRAGEFVMIRGPSGGGKTTLLNLLGTIDETSSGSIEMFGHSINAASKDAFLADLRLNKIGFVFQTFNLLATMSAFENVELPMIMRGQLSKNESRIRALELLDLVGLQDRYGHLPSELSGGEQQRVTIARALANEPELLLLDEPTGDLDSRNTVDIMDLILQINLGQLSSSTTHRPTTVIMVTHNPDLECYADRILYVEDGSFKKQALNRKQRKIDYDKYVVYINSHH